MQERTTSRFRRPAHIPTAPLFLGRSRVFPVLGTLLCVVSILSLVLGQYQIGPLKVLRIFLAPIFHLEQDWNPALSTVIWNIRLPRLIAGLLVGAGLSVSGAAFQGLFRNPLVSPHILGVSAGAGFGAALGILFFPRIFFIQFCAFLFGTLSVFMTYMLSRFYRSTPVLMLVLAGIIVGSLFSAGTSLLKYIADPVNNMPSIVFWLLGSLNNVSNNDLAIAAPLMLGGILVLVLVRWRVNLLAMGEEDARALGVHTGRMKGLVIVSVTVVCAAAVSITGVIGWIGLVIPHIGRMVVGPDNKVLIPASAIIGASYLVAVDTVARTALETEIPIGILTAMIGAPIFAYLLRKNRPGW